MEQSKEEEEELESIYQDQLKTIKNKQMEEKETTNLDSNEDMVNYRQLKKNSINLNAIVLNYMAELEQRCIEIIRDSQQYLWSIYQEVGNRTQYRVVVQFSEQQVQTVQTQQSRDSPLHS